MNSLGAKLFVISPENGELIAEVREKIDIDYIGLSDHTGEAMRRFRLAFTMDDETIDKYSKYGIDVATTSPTGRWELPAPGTFVIDTDGIIRYAFSDWDYSKRADNEKILEALREFADDD